MRLSLTNLVCVLFDPAIPTSFFNFIQLFFILAPVLFLLHIVHFINAILHGLLTTSSSVIKWTMGGAEVS